MLNVGVSSVKLDQTKFLSNIKEWTLSCLKRALSLTFVFYSRLSKKLPNYLDRLSPDAVADGQVSVPVLQTSFQHPFLNIKIRYPVLVEILWLLEPDSSGQWRIFCLFFCTLSNLQSKYLI